MHNIIEVKTTQYHIEVNVKLMNMYELFYQKTLFWGKKQSTSILVQT